MNSRSRNNLLLNWLLNTVVLFKNETLDNVIDIKAVTLLITKPAVLFFPVLFPATFPSFPNSNPLITEPAIVLRLLFLKLV